MGAIVLIRPLSYTLMTAAAAVGDSNVSGREIDNARSNVTLTLKNNVAASSLNRPRRTRYRSRCRANQLFRRWSQNT